MAEHAALNQLATGLRSKKQEHDALAVKYGEQHPTMRTLGEEIAVLEAQLAAEKARNHRVRGVRRTARPTPSSRAFARQPARRTRRA